MGHDHMHAGLRSYDVWLGPSRIPCQRKSQENLEIPHFDFHQLDIHDNDIIMIS